MACSVKLGGYRDNNIFQSLDLDFAMHIISKTKGIGKSFSYLQARPSLS